MAILPALFYFLLTSSALLRTPIGTAISAATTTTMRTRKLVAKPIHNPNETISDRAERAITSSISRLAYLQAKMEARATYCNDITIERDDRQVPVVAGGNIFLANFYLLCSLSFLIPQAVFYAA